MAKCGAGSCEIGCGGGKRCGCIAESDNPDNCTSIFTGGTTRGGVKKLGATTLVGVSTSDLPLIEVAQLLNAVYTESIAVPVDRMREPISASLQ
jgi:hypothetical protein